MKKNKKLDGNLLLGNTQNTFKNKVNIISINMPEN
jgi:hypothetical protein